MRPWEPARPSRYEASAQVLDDDGTWLDPGDAQCVFEIVDESLPEGCVPLGPRGERVEVGTGLRQLLRCLDLLRSSGRVVPTEDIEEQAADDVISRLEDAMMVRDGLSRLGPECQEILDRFFARDESYRTIGDALDIPAGTIASRISRCLGHLRAEVEQ